MLVNVIVAYCKNGGIGINNTLPWKISSDLKKFKKMTLGNKNNAG
jgi:dihydrofolate reductase